MSIFGHRVEEDFRDRVFENILGEVIDWIIDNLVPEDVFPEKQLEEWAEENGYTRIN